MNKEPIYVPRKPNSLSDILFCHFERKKTTLGQVSI